MFDTSFYLLIGWYQHNRLQTRAISIQERVLEKYFSSRILDCS